MPFVTSAGSGSCLAVTAGPKPIADPSVVLGTFLVTRTAIQSGCTFITLGATHVGWAARAVRNELGAILVWHWMRVHTVRPFSTAEGRPRVVRLTLTKVAAPFTAFARPVGAARVAVLATTAIHTSWHSPRVVQHHAPQELLSSTFFE